MENIGLLYSDNRRSLNISPIEPENVIKRLLEIKKEEMSQLTKNVNLVTRKLTQIYENNPKDKLVWKVAIGDDLHKSDFNLLAEANRGFLGYQSPNRLRLVNFNV